MSNIPKNIDNIAIRVVNQISHVLVHQRNVETLLREVFDILQHEMELQRGTLTLKRDDFLFIQASRGLSGDEQKRGKYKIGEGITGKVAEKGELIIIPDISKEPAFLDRTRARGSAKVAFICVPIKHEGEVIGTLSIDYKPDPEFLKPLSELLQTVANILADAVATFRSELEEREMLIEENIRLRHELGDQFRPGNIIGNCGNMRSVYQLIAQVADSPATVLVRGESGTGKELVARAIHYASSRKDSSFLAVNCAALPENLIESELFGHEKGAFTGAVKPRKGRFELADGGTLFLDEIGDISLPVQIKLLRVLQEQCFERVGGHNSVKVNVRILAATSRNLEEDIRKGSFREDLYYRLNVFPISLPPLRKRKSDIVLLADFFLEKYNKVYNRKVRRITTPAINMMMSYHWPGNVRELENCIERALLTTTNDVISAYNLPPSLQTAQQSGTDFVPEENADFATMVASFEREIIVDSLKKTRGNIAAAARNLNTTQRIIHYKTEKYNINPDDFR